MKTLLKPVVSLLFFLLWINSSRAQTLPCNSWLSTPNNPSSIRVGNINVTGNQLTVEALIYSTSSTVGNNNGDVVSKHQSPADDNYLLRPDYCSIATGNGTFFQTPALCPITNNQVHHIAMVYNGVNLTFYRDGILSSQIAANGNLVQNNFITSIGYYSLQMFNSQFIGFINEVRIWNVARTQTQLTANMFNLPNPTTQTGLLAYYTFNSLVNKQGNAAFNGTFNGNATINATIPNCSFTPVPCCQPNASSTVYKCPNVNIPLNAQSGTTYNWAPSTGLNATNIQNPICSVATNTTYTVTVFNSVTNCTNVDTVKVIVNPPPFSNIHDTTICSGDTVRLSAYNGTTYSWTPNYNINNTTISNPLVWPAVTTSYIVTITNANGCSTKDTVKVTVGTCHCEDTCNWSLTGNSNVLPRNFIGSINNADFNIKTNNTQRMVVKSDGSVGIGTSSPGRLLEVNGEARIVTLPGFTPNDKLVFANGSGDLHSQPISGDPNQYLSGDGSWQNVPTGGGGGGITDAANGLTTNGTTVSLGDKCGGGRGKFEENREVNMNNQNLYFNSDKAGKLFMGYNSNFDPEAGCKKLYTRLEIGTKGLSAENNYNSPDPSSSGLRFSDLNANTDPVQNRTGGVLSLDEDGDVIWVKTCCTGEQGKESELKDILERLTKLENELKASKDEANALKEQLSQMDVLLSNNSMVVLNQNVPNPFDEKTVITYMIPKTFHQAQIIFTSINGEVIKTTEIKQSGKGQINVFAKDISSGLYTYTLIVDGKIIDTKKMVKQ